MSPIKPPTDPSRPRPWLWRCDCGNTFRMSVTRHCLYCSSNSRNVWIDRIGVDRVRKVKGMHGKYIKKYIRAKSSINYRTWQVRRDGQPSSPRLTPEEILIWNTCYESDFDHPTPARKDIDWTKVPRAAHERIGAPLLKEINRYRKLFSAPLLHFTEEELGVHVNANRAVTHKTLCKEFRSIPLDTPSEEVAGPKPDISWWNLLWNSGAGAVNEGVSTDPEDDSLAAAMDDEFYSDTQPIPEPFSTRDGTTVRFPAFGSKAEGDFIPELAVNKHEEEGPVGTHDEMFGCNLAPGNENERKSSLPMYYHFRDKIVVLPANDDDGEVPDLQLSSTNDDDDNDDSAPPTTGPVLLPNSEVGNSTSGDAYVSAPIPTTRFTDMWGRQFDTEHYEDVSDSQFYQGPDGDWKPVDEVAIDLVASLPTAPEWVLVGMGVVSRRRRDSGYESLVDEEDYMKEAFVISCKG